MRTTYIILGLATLSAVLGLYMATSPEQAEELSRVRRDMAFTGETRELALVVIGIGLAGFIGYLTMSRR